MRGNQTIHFSELFEDSVRTHGAAWCQAHYMARGMCAWEFAFWMRSCNLSWE